MRSKQARRLLAPSAALALVGGLLWGLAAGCARRSTETLRLTATPPPISQLPDQPPSPNAPAGPINPLTGLAVSDPAALNRRPLAVKVSNAPDSVRPQAGLAQADLVFEHYVEGSLTRFTALFWTHTPPRVGSVRSARLIDLEIPAMYGALFAYSGANEPIRARLAALPFAPRAFEGVSTGAPLYYRDPGLEAPHNLFVIPAEVWARAAVNGLNDPPTHLNRMVFDPAPPPGGTQAARVTIDYGPDVVRWDYDPVSGRYWRSVDGVPHTDANTGEPITAANVIVLYVHHQPDYSIVASEWQGQKTYSTEIQLWTLGPALICRDGQVARGFWMRWEEDSMLSFWADEQATRLLTLKPGNTWFQIVPLDFTGVQIE